MQLPRRGRVVTLSTLHCLVDFDSAVPSFYHCEVHLAKRDYNEALDCAKSRALGTALANMDVQLIWASPFALFLAAGMASLYDELQEDKLAAKAPSGNCDHTNQSFMRFCAG